MEWLKKAWESPIKLKDLPLILPKLPEGLRESTITLRKRRITSGTLPERGNMSKLV
jgi:hypothetical protein